MVKLTLTPHRGNGARTFPSTGCLGMTPVTLAGVVRVKIEEDLKSVEASSLVVRVRCYESVDGGAPPPTTDASTSTGPSERASSSSGYHSSSCLGGSSSNPSGYSISDILRGGASSSTSASGNNAKGRVLYEKSVQMWSPPSPSTSSNKSDSATQSSSSTSSSRSSSLERSLQHAYPPRSREVSHSSSLSSAIPSSSSSTSSQSNVLQYATLGEFTKAWRIVIPINAIEKGGAKSTMIYKNWRIWWTVEAVISHRPSGIHGDKIIKSHQVALLSYAPLPSLNPPLTWASSSNDTHPLSYNITTPISVFGSSDPVQFQVQLSKKNAMAETPKKVIVELRREICYCSASNGSSSARFSRQSSEAQSSKDRLSYSKAPKYTRNNSGGLLSNILLPPPIAHLTTSSYSKMKSESTEALIVTTPPALSNASTVSSFSTYMPPTPPPLKAHTPGEYIESTSESYFGLFSNGTSSNSVQKESHSTVRPQQYPSQQQHVYVPPAPIPITQASSAHSRNQDNKKKKGEEIATLAIFEIDCLFTSPTWQGKIIGNLPKSKSLYHYALGETCFTSCANSKFYFVPKIQYKSKNSFIELAKIEIYLSTVSSEERKKAYDMRGKVVAIQKAEARLFGGSDDNEDSTIEKDEEKKKRARSKKISSSSTSASQHNSKPPSSTSAPRIRTSQSVSPRVGTGASSSSPTLPLPSTSETEDEITPRSSTVRRRSSEQSTESYLETPLRTRQRFGSTSDLSPIIGSPFLEAVSPSLSVISSFTTRPRTTGSGRSRPNTANSSKSSTLGGGIGRPRSSAGVDITSAAAAGTGVTSSAWSTFSNSTGNFTIDATASAEVSHLSSQTTNTMSTTVSSTSSSEPPSYSSMTSSSTSPSSSEQSPKSINSTIEEDLHSQASSSGFAESHYNYSQVTNATVNGLFAEFSGFSLKPDDNAAPGSTPRTPIIREELVPPKSTVPYTSSKRTARHVVPSANNSAASNKRKVTETDDRSAVIAKGGSDALISSSSSSALLEITPPASTTVKTSHTSLLSPTSARSSTSMTKASSHDSSSNSIVGLGLASSQYSHNQQDTGGNSPRRVKSGMSGAFSFFRRSSTKT